MGDKNNIQLIIVANNEEKPAGGIYLTDEIYGELEEIVGNDNIRID